MQWGSAVQWGRQWGSAVQCSAVGQCSGAVQWGREWVGQPTACCFAPAYFTFSLLLIPSTAAVCRCCGLLTGPADTTCWPLTGARGCTAHCGPRTDARIHQPISCTDDVANSILAQRV